MKPMYRVIGALLLCFAAIVGFRAAKHASIGHADIPRPSASTLPTANASRKVYPFSVIPGGVESARDVQAAIHDDAAVAAHYASLKVANLKPVKQVGDVRRYVSYRMNGAIYWTSKPVTIKHGELLLTDGSTTLRGRCGNILSETPQVPTQNTKAEPPPDELDIPIQLGYVPQLRFIDTPPVDIPLENRATEPTPAPPTLLSATNGLPTMPAMPAMPPIGPLTSGISSAASNIPGVSMPPILSFPVTNSTNNPPTPNPSTQGPVEVAETPEPSTIVMLSFGLACLFLLRQIRRRHAFRAF